MAGRNDVSVVVNAFNEADDIGGRRTGPRTARAQPGSSADLETTSHLALRPRRALSPGPRSWNGDTL
jgi:hypothetical protein